MSDVIGHVNKEDETPEQMLAKDTDIKRKALFAKALNIGIYCSIIRNQLQVKAIYKELARVLGDMPNNLSKMTYEEEYFFKFHLPPMLKCGLDAMQNYMDRGNALADQEIEAAKTHIKETEIEIESMKANYVGDNGWENGTRAALNLF